MSHTAVGKLKPTDTCSYQQQDLMSGAASAASARLSLRRRRNIKQLTRLTVVLDDHSANHQLMASNPVVASYDILAVVPMTEKVFQCTFIFENRLLYGQCADAGM